MISANDLRGALAIMPTPAKEGADRLDATNTIDLDETARLAESLVRDGATGIMALGTMGECATTSQSDYEPYVDCLLQTVRGRIPTFVGTTALGGHEIARRIRFVKERGATGTLLGIPMWQPATLDMAVQFYASVAETFPNFPIMVYANPRAFRFAFGVDFWKPIVDRGAHGYVREVFQQRYPPRGGGRDQGPSEFRSAGRPRLRVCSAFPGDGDHMLDSRSWTAAGPRAHEGAGGARRPIGQDRGR